MTPAGVMDETPLDAALGYASRGWRVLPIKPGQKRPPMSSWQHAATTEERTIRNWFDGLYRGHGVGIATGPESGIWVLDVDTGMDKHGEDSLEVLTDTHGPLPLTVEAITGSGGRHILFKWPKGRVVRTRRELSSWDGLDVRGEGGQVVAAPTLHPNGTPYSWVEGQSPDDVEVAEAPEWLLELVCDRDEPIVLPDPKPITADGGDSIAEWVNQSVDWTTQLTADGWSPHRPHGNEQYWTRPGKEVREGHSAVLHLPDGPFVVFSTDSSLSHFMRPEAQTRTGDGFAYSPFGYMAVTRHGGDRSACARSYRQQRTAIENVYTHPSGSSIAASAELHEAEAALAESIESDWDSISLSDITAAMRTGDYHPIVPSVLEVADSTPLFYSGRINSLFGESGGGKTWVALAAIAEEARAGRRSAMVDYEDNANGIAERLFFLGLTDDEVALVDYRNPTTGIGLGVAPLERRALERSYSLVVVDSTGEAMAAAGVDPNSDAETARWFAVIKALCRLEGAPAVVVLDHIPKAQDAPASFAIGSQRKRAAVTGASYRVDTLREPAKGKDGRLKLTVAKDRPGTRAKGSVAAMVDIASLDGSVDISLHLSDAQIAAEKGERFRPTVYMERVSRWLELNPGATTNAIVAAIKGKRAVTIEAIATLTQEAYVTIEPGPRGASIHRSVRSYREFADPAQVASGTDSSTGSHRFPTGSPLVPGTSGGTGPTGSPPFRGNQSQEPVEDRSTGSLDLDEVEVF